MSNIEKMIRLTSEMNVLHKERYALENEIDESIKEKLQTLTKTELIHLLSVGGGIGGLRSRMAKKKIEEEAKKLPREIGPAVFLPNDGHQFYNSTCEECNSIAKKLGIEL